MDGVGDVGFFLPELALTASSGRCLENRQVPSAALDSPSMEDVLVSPDLLSRIYDSLGMRQFLLSAAVCRSWSEAATAKLESLHVLDHVATIDDNTGLLGPDSVCVVPGGRNLCVADNGNDRLLVISPGGEVLRKIRLEGSLGQLKFHTGLAAYGDAFFVVDNACHCLRKLSLKDGTPVGRVGSMGHEDGKLAFPEGLALLGGNLYVAGAATAPRT